MGSLEDFIIGKGPRSLIHLLSNQIDAGSSQVDHDRFPRDFCLGRSSNKAN